MAFPLLLAPIVTMLAEKGLNLLSKAVDSGSDKAIEFIEEKTGLKLLEPEVESKITSEKLAELRKLEKDYELELMRLALEDKKENNRHNESISGSIIADKQNARGSNHLYELQSDVGKRIFIQTSIIIPLLIMINVLLISYASDLKLSEAMISMVSTLIGIALNNAYRERQSMIEFLFGSSIANDISNRKG